MDIDDEQEDCPLGDVSLSTVATSNAPSAYDDEATIRWRTPDFSVLRHRNGYVFPVGACEVKPALYKAGYDSSMLKVLPYDHTDAEYKKDALAVMNGTRAQANAQIQCIFSECQGVQALKFIFTCGFWFTVVDVTRPTDDSLPIPADITDLDHVHFIFVEDVLHNQHRLVLNPALVELWRNFP